MKAIIIALFIGIFMFSCTPINNLEDPQKDVETVVDSKLLLGYWYDEKGKSGHLYNFKIYQQPVFLMQVLDYVRSDACTDAADFTLLPSAAPEFPERRFFIHFFP